MNLCYNLLCTLKLVPHLYIKLKHVKNNNVRIRAIVESNLIANKMGFYHKIWAQTSQGIMCVLPKKIYHIQLHFQGKSFLFRPTGKKRQKSNLFMAKGLNLFFWYVLSLLIFNLFVRWWHYWKRQERKLKLFSLTKSSEEILNLRWSANSKYNQVNYFLNNHLNATNVDLTKWHFDLFSLTKVPSRLCWKCSIIKTFLLSQNVS